MFMSDREIKDLCSFVAEPELNMISGFAPYQIRKVASLTEEGERGVISYGLSAYGYDIRLSPDDFRIFRRIPGDVVDPKNFSTSNLESMTANGYSSRTDGIYFILPAHTYALGVSMERFNLPKNVTGICMGKSTYARCGVIVNITPLEAGWKGYLTIEISNSSDSDVRVYAREGIAQILFSAGNPCMTSYADRKGKYQDQPNQVITARI